MKMILLTPMAEMLRATLTEVSSGDKDDNGKIGFRSQCSQ